MFGGVEGVAILVLGVWCGAVRGPLDIVLFDIFGVEMLGYCLTLRHPSQALYSPL